MSSQAHPMPYGQPLWTPGRAYDPRRQLGAIELGDAPAVAACPTRSYWWLALAFAAGAVGGYKYTREKKRAGRRGG